MKEKIAKLVGFYYRTLVDHHKDRDCHFYVQTMWSYGKPPVFSAQHHGYIREFEQEFKTYEEAETFLAETIIEVIREEIAAWRGMNATEGIFGISQDEIDSNRAHMEKLEADLNAFLTPST